MMKSKELLLWVVVVVALGISLLAIFGSRLQGLRSDASYNPNIRQITRQDIGSTTSGEPKIGSACIIGSASSEYNEAQTPGKIEYDPISKTYRCVARDESGSIIAIAPVDS